MPLRVVLDANVLFPMNMRDTLLRLAEDEYIQVSWSEEILEEARRNLVETETINDQQATRLFDAMRTAFDDAMVTGYETLIPQMKNDVGDRHVAAVAKKVDASAIVTSNLKHFKELPDGISAISPDAFLVKMFDRDPDGIVTLLRKQAADRKRTSFEELLSQMEKSVPQFISAVREWECT